MGEVVKKNVLVGPNGELIFDLIEDVDEVVLTNKEIREKVGGWSENRDRRMVVSVPPRLYYLWANRLGEECWTDPAFLRSFIKEHPEYCTCNGRV